MGVLWRFRLLRQQICAQGGAGIFWKQTQLHRPSPVLTEVRITPSKRYVQHGHCQHKIWYLHVQQKYDSGMLECILVTL